MDVNGRNGSGGITIVLAESDTRRRAAVRHALEHHGFAVVGEAADATSVTDLALQHRPRVCLLGIDIPGGAILAADRIVERAPETKIAILAEDASDANVFSALAAGANGYLLRKAAPDRLSASLKGILDGDMVVPQTAMSSLVAASRAWEMPQQPPRGVSWRLMYPPRFIGHVVRLLRDGYPPRVSWRSARRRMHLYA